MFERLNEKLSARDVLLGLLGAGALWAFHFLLKRYIYGWLDIPASSYPNDLWLNFGCFTATMVVYVICGWAGLVGKYPCSSLVISFAGGITLPVMLLWFFRGN